ncbi:MAG: hypothetical protein ACI831_001899 [Candidatus Azotimanducaceae bacterium]
MVLTFTPEVNDLFSEIQLSHISALQARLNKIEGVKNMVSIFDARYTTFGDGTADVELARKGRRSPGCMNVVENCAKIRSVHDQSQSKATIGFVLAATMRFTTCIDLKRNEQPAQRCMLLFKTAMEASAERCILRHLQLI